MAIDINDLDLDIEVADPRVRRNSAEVEQWASMIGGGALVLFGLSRKSFGGVLLAAIGGGLIYHGRTAAKKMLPAELTLEASTTIFRSPEEVYRFYRDFDNLPRFMKHLKSVTPLGGGRSRWAMSIPGGRLVEWDAQIVEDREYELIRWRSLEGADLQHHGQVRFDRAPGDRGTEVHVRWRYHPPGAGFGAIIAKLAKVYTSSTLKDELRRMKQILEAGEIATTEGQPSGRELQEPIELTEKLIREPAAAEMELDEQGEPHTLH